LPERDRGLDAPQNLWFFGASQRSRRLAHPQPKLEVIVRGVENRGIEPVLNRKEWHVDISPENQRRAEGQLIPAPSGEHGLRAGEAFSLPEGIELGAVHDLERQQERARGTLAHNTCA